MKTVAAWTAIALLFATAASGVWEMYDECFSQDDYNVTCRKGYMALRESIRDAILGPRKP